MRQLASLFALAAFLTFGLGTTLVSATEPAPTEQKEKKDVGTKLNAEEEKKGEKKDTGNKLNLDDEKKSDKKEAGGK